MTQRRLCWLALGAAMAASVALLLYLQRNYTFVADEIPFLEWTGNEPWISYFGPYNGNLHFAAVAMTRVLLEVFGAGNYLPYRLFGLAGLVLCTGVLYVYCRRLVGEVLALAPPIALLFMGTGWAILLQPFVGSVLLYSLALGTAALLCLERGDRGGDIAACLLLVGALLFYSVGFPFVVGATVAILLAPRWRSRLWIVLIPGVLYLGWRMSIHFIDSPPYLSQLTGERANIFRAPLYFIDSGALVAGALFAGGRDFLTTGPATGLVSVGFSWSRLLATLVIAAIEIGIIVAVFTWLRRRGPIRPGVWVSVAMLVALWGMQSYVFGGGRTAAESRYLFAGAFFLLLIICQVAAPVERASRRVIAFVGVLLVISVGLNVDVFRDPHQLLRDYSPRARADMAAVQLAGDRAPYEFTPNSNPAVPFALYLNAGPWNAMVADHGSPAFTGAEVREQPVGVRQEADGVLTAALGMRAVPVSGHGPCGPPSTRSRALRPGRTVVIASSPAFLALGHYGFPRHGIALLAAGEPQRVLLARSGSTRFRVGTVPAAPFRLCATR